jgi:predicted acylesterase/phospholipase RssA
MKVINTLVLSGGGIKGIAYCGVFKKLKELQEIEENCNVKIDIKEIMAVSVGTIFGLVYILNYSYEELYEEIMEKNFMEFLNNKVSRFIKGYGLNSGKNIIKWVESLLLKRGYSKNTTFSELYKKTNIHYKIMVTNLNKHKLTKFDYIDTPKIKITKAIRMAITIPFAFSVLTYKNDIYVDGALINNFPINLYENKENILGIDFLYSKKDKDEVIDSLDKYIYNVISCYISVKEDQTREERCKENILEFFVERSALDFDLSYDDKQKMIDYGYGELDRYFKNYLKE